MSIFRKKIDDITIDDIEKFVVEKHPENIRIEYKSAFSASNPNLQIAKEVSAFANQQGGIILYGVDEDADSSRRPRSIVGIDKNLNPRQKIQSVCIDHIYPPIVPEIQECELKNNSAKVVVFVRVEMSDAVPHTINNRTGFYIRVQDRSDPREMTDEEIELLWDRRKKLIERREYLLKRAYDRVFAAGKTKETLPNPIYLMAVPLYPMTQLINKSKLLEIHAKSSVPQGQGFPLTTDRIRTAADSIYCYLPHKEEEQAVQEIGKERYSEIGVFGQIAHFENAIHTWKDATGILLGYELHKLYFMVKYMANFYQSVGYWGVVHFVLSIQNCLGQKLYPPSNISFFRDKMSEIEVDSDIRIERNYPVSYIAESPEKIVVDIITELLWDAGLSVHSANQIPVLNWLEREKISTYGKKPCPVCNRDIASIDVTCLDCKNKETVIKDESKATKSSASYSSA